jgi:hypothetical protein
MSDVVTPNGATALAAALGPVHRLVGMMGAGKSSVGRRLAARLGVPFVDADIEIEKAAGMTITEIFAAHGEPYFRRRGVIVRLLEGRPECSRPAAARSNPETRAAIHAKASRSGCAPRSRC